MKESTSTNLCARAEDLVTYLYGEATESEALEFKDHIERCTSCRAELAMFRDVREAVGGWRQYALGSLVSHGSETNATRAFEPAASPVRERSALAALRQFFTLSPIWMRAATAMAAIAFCALAAIAVAYFVQRPRTVIVEIPGKSGYSDDQVKAMIGDALKKQNEMQEKRAPGQSSERLESASNEKPEVQSTVQRRGSSAPRRVDTVQRRQIGPRRVAPLSTTEALASSDYLPFTAPGDEERLPSLSDLVDDEDN